MIIKTIFVSGIASFIFYFFNLIYQLIFLKVFTSFNIEDTNHLLILSSIKSLLFILLIILFFKIKNISFLKSKYNDGLLSNINNMFKYGSIIFFIFFIIFLVIIKCNMNFFDSMIYSNDAININNFDNYTMKILIIVLLNVILEEFYFRFTLVKVLEEKYSEKVIALISAFSFGFIHSVDILSIISATIIGYFLAVTFLKTKRLVYSIFLHFIVNINSILINPIIKLLDPQEKLGENWLFLSFLIMFTIFFIMYILTKILGKMWNNKRLLFINSNKC
ncbi:CPBP family intramembrane glutamic endopeptidase [Peptoniphilus vaginalis]|uniref:CPBP family intramembrane glutamic endopeptidase n=1 Tax=Peptoniphilus vaginalis TaxID=1756987 RepID=UPI0023F9E0E9|nr:CPBP family intramembrane glutamic endopeptidase [Peptoniphilus vaginalis]